MLGRVPLLPILLILITVPLHPAGAAQGRIQDSPPARVDLSALALRPGDVPEPGWRHAGAFMEDLASEAGIVAGYRGGVTAEQVTAQLVSFGWQRMHVNVLHAPSGPGATPVSESSSPAQRIRSYVTDYTSAEGAAAGFAYLEDEGAIPSAADIPASRQFGEQSELTSDEGISGVDGRPFRSLDLTFRAGNLVAGVTLIAYGTVAGAGPDVATVEALAAVLEARLQATPEGTGLGAMIARFGGERHQITVYDDAYYRITGSDIPLIDESPASAALRIESYADATDVYQLWQGIDVGGASGVLYGVTALRFPDESAATAWVDSLQATLGENPFYGNLRQVEIPGDLEYQAVALSYVSGGGSPDAPHAMLVAIRVGSVVGRVHVVPQGGLSDVPLAAVLALAQIQADCLGGDRCAEVTDLPAELAGAGPAASPVPFE